jgi:2-(1,2-epoxy-1,2-dihydrophenyl)acetyl-CoA isomerase
VGLRKAMEIALLGESFGVEEAHRLGLVNRVVPAAELLPHTLALGQRLANGPTLALGKMKRLLRGSFDHTLDQQLDLESQAFQDSTRTADFSEALQAFFAKRKPDFKGA